MTTKQAPQRKAHAQKNTMGHDGLPRVFGTGRRETTARKVERRYQILIQRNTKNHCFAHAKDSGQGSEGDPAKAAILRIKGSSSV
jgi:hypothetical protein